MKRGSVLAEFLKRLTWEELTVPHNDTYFGDSSRNYFNLFCSFALLFLWAQITEKEFSTPL